MPNNSKGGYWLTQFIPWTQMHVYNTLQYLTLPLHGLCIINLYWSFISEIKYEVDGLSGILVVKFSLEWHAQIGRSSDDHSQQYMIQFTTMTSMCDMIYHSKVVNLTQKFLKLKNRLPNVQIYYLDQVCNCKQVEYIPFWQVLLVDKHLC